jgi:hypothetical protein
MVRANQPEQGFGSGFLPGNRPTGVCEICSYLTIHGVNE